MTDQDPGRNVPVVKHAEGLNLLGIARSVTDVAQRARDKKLLPVAELDRVLTGDITEKEARDQADKSYVQHKMLNCGDEIWKWMDGEGAHFFVCGDARRMAKDVDAALRKIIQEKGGKSESETNEYVEKLKSDKRYKRDVY